MKKKGYLCNNRQCLSCIYVRINRQNQECYCSYILDTGHMRGCPIPFCEKYQPVSEKRRAKNLKRSDFLDWYIDHNDAEALREIAEEENQPKRRSWHYVIATSEDNTIVFQSIREAAKHFSCLPIKIREACKSGEPIQGYTLERETDIIDNAL